MKRRLKLVATVRADYVDAKREFLHRLGQEVDRVFLRVAGVDLDRSNARGLIDRGALKAPHGLAALRKRLP